MNISGLFQRWTELLAGIVTDWQARSQRRKSIVVTRGEGCFILNRPGNAGVIAPNIAFRTMPPPEIAQVLRKRFIIFEQSVDQVVMRRLPVPAQAREFLPGIVSNQIERLSPWPPGQALYAIDAKPNPDNTGVLDVSVFIASRASIDALCNELTESGLAPHRIAVRGEALSPSGTHVLWTRPAPAPQRQSQSLPRLIGIGLTTVVVLSAAVSLWAGLSASAITAESEEAAGQIQGLRHFQTSQKPRDLALLKPAERAWALKENTPVAVLTLEALSRALPDSAYLTELHLENARLRITGLATDAPSLIAALEQSGRFSEVHFFAPTTRAQSGNLYKFFIESKVAERPMLAGD